LSINNEDLRARIEPVHLHQVLMNLVINARDAMNEYGAIEISLHRETIKSHCNACHENLREEFVVISVNDTGSGMDSHVVSKIFDPFFTTKEVGKGTGMGLSVVHGLVHGVGGHILANSQPGAGTTISICLPLVESLKIATRPSSTLVPGDRGILAGLKVMLVDDEVMLCHLWGEVLGHHGAEVSIFTNPLEALRTFEKDPDSVDLVITDQNMPELSGSDMARTMLCIRSNVPMILCTGHAENVNEAKTLELGFAAFLQKPVDIEEFFRVLPDLALTDHGRPGIRNLV
jgi:CheY-like chemotaxis protein